MISSGSELSEQSFLGSEQFLVLVFWVLGSGSKQLCCDPAQYFPQYLFIFFLSLYVFFLSPSLVFGLVFSEGYSLKFK